MSSSTTQPLLLFKSCLEKLFLKSLNFFSPTPTCSLLVPRFFFPPLGVEQQVLEVSMEAWKGFACTYIAVTMHACHCACHTLPPHLLPVSCFLKPFPLCPSHGPGLMAERHFFGCMVIYSMFITGLPTKYELLIQSLHFSFSNPHKS